MSFKDHFSGHANSYAAARPTYPESLFKYLAKLCSSNELAWDCATGNGQAATGLSPYFNKVLATDASSEQIEQGQFKENLEYQVMPAENPDIADSSADLITVAQAIHWFDIDKFFESTRRVLKADGVLAVWSYGLHEINPRCDEITAHLYSDIVGKYWPTERCYVETRYQDIHFPFTNIESPSFEIICKWSAQDVLNYYHSWSAVQRYMADKGSSPLELIEAEFVAAWDSESQRDVRWPISLHVSRKPA
ncbi:MAG: methyltransferase domain-containing protein [Pseudomonadales bacterium]|nr:methyltransferase domain-containing protein [Pseudomonadales bacterium]